MTTFVMEARENYDPSNASLLNNNTPYKQMSCDPSNVVTGFDAQRRVMTYLAMVVPAFTSGVTYNNPTGFTLFTGSEGVFAPGAAIHLNVAFSPQVAQKNIDTDAVTFYQTYNSSNTVPANVGSVWLHVGVLGTGYTHVTLTLTSGGGVGMTAVGILDAGGGGYLLDAKITNWGTGASSPGLFSVSGDGSSATISSGLTGSTTGSDGTWRWIGRDFTNSVNLNNGPGIINPHTNNYAVNAESCEVYHFTLANSFAQTLAPAIYASNTTPSDAPVCVPRGVDTTWFYCIAQTVASTAVKGWNLLLMPASDTATETTASSKLFYVIWGTNPFRTDAGVRLTFGTDGNVYLFSIYANGSGKYAFRLTQYQPPALGTYGANLPGTMTDVTPWAAATGPNSDGASYTINTSGTAPNYTWHIPFHRLPGTGSACAISKYLKEDSSSTTDYTKTLISATFVTLSGTPTFTYHSGFISGYMTSLWATAGSIPVTGFAVLDAVETNNFLDQSDFVYTGWNYTKRYFRCQVHPIVGSTVQATFQTIFAQYDISNPAIAPVLESAVLYNGASWDAIYTAYGTAISDANVVAASVLNGYGANSSTAAVTTNTNGAEGWVYLDPMLIDDTAPSFVGWASGLTVPSDDVNAAVFNNLFHLNSAFTNRAAFNTSATTTGGITPPFLRLSVGGVVNTGVYTFGEIL